MSGIALSIAVCLFGGLGASCRYLADTTIKTYWKRAFPLSTFAINVVAGLLAGVVAALVTTTAGTGTASAANVAPMIDESWRLMLATGFLGGFSTFSTAINEMVTLFKARRYPTAAGYLAASVVTPALAVAVGFLIVS